MAQKSMTDRPTPETDAFFLTFSDGEAAPSHADYYDRMVRLERERDEAREWQAMLSGWGGTPEIVNDFIKGQQMRIYAAQNAERERHEALEELSAERALADRLANLLTACERWVNQPCDVKTEANKVLMAWKEARNGPER